jgi:predicted enzyme related to lactoylglutathione lyase
MSEQDRYISGVPCWADTNQPDPAAAAEFYGGLFGWQLEESMPEGSPGSYLMARLDGGSVAAISSPPEGAPPEATWNTYVLVESADATAAAVREAGGQVLREPFDIGDTGRMATFADPEGAVFSVWQAGSFRGADVVNAHGSVNFNDLYVRDLERAQAFYGAVFGWDPLPMHDAGGMWALRGYGDHLELRNPGNRQGMKDMGAPERFEDVVASFSRIDDDSPARWSLTFAVDDADAVAARARELGGTVVVEPFDMPWVRQTVITDPQGATFTASKFVPENQDAAGQEADSAVRGS